MCEQVAGQNPCWSGGGDFVQPDAVLMVFFQKTAALAVGLSSCRVKVVGIVAGNMDLWK